jgi:hypothetical protein
MRVLPGESGDIRAVRSEARGTILAGGIALVGGALAFLGVFSYLAARFHYPEVLDGDAQDVLPALLAAGAAGRAAWALYGVLPLVFSPAVVAAANNYLLPAWMIGFGVWLVIMSRTERLTPAHV